MKNSILFTAACALLTTGCTEMTDYYPNAVIVEIDGMKHFVSHRENNGDNVYLAGPNTPTIKDNIMSRDFQQPVRNIAAIEAVTKCKVIPSTVENLDVGTTFAGVDCT